MKGNMRNFERFLERQRCLTDSVLGLSVPRGMPHATNRVEEDKVLSPVDPVQLELLTEVQDKSAE